MRRASPRLLTDGCVDRVGSVERCPVAAVDRDLVRRPRGVDGAVFGGVVLVKDDGLHAVQRVEGDRRHLVHVLGGRVDDRVVRVELARHDRIAPVVPEQRQDLLCPGSLAALGQLTILVVGELDVLRGAEGLERGAALLDLVERVATGGDESQTDESEDDAEGSQSTDHWTVPLVDLWNVLLSIHSIPNGDSDAQ